MLSAKIIGMHHHVNLEMILLKKKKERNDFVVPFMGLVLIFISCSLIANFHFILVYQNFKGLIWEFFASEKMSFALHSARVCCI